MRWFERQFAFDLPEAMFDVVVERLRGTPARIEDKVRRLPPDILTRRHGDKWSIQEHIGHLLDLDDLHTGRLDDYLAGAQTLRPADLQNKRTHEGGHNRRPTADLLEEFRREREAFVTRLEGWDRGRVGQSAIHPRLQQPMRVIDMAFFVAEHDDHHLAAMSELARRFGANESRPRAGAANP